MAASPRCRGFGTFRDSTAAATGRDAREEVRSQWEQCGHDAQSFRSWLLGRIGVWVDYMCMPQAPHSEAERLEFREALAWLDGLVVSSTVVSLRDAGDDYPERGWCAAEFFLASGRSFQRGLFVTQGRLMTGQDALVGPSPDADGHAESMAVKVMADGYGMDLQAFEEACGEWETLDVALIDTSPPDAWGAYRALQGSGFWTPELDPNPFRRAMEAIRGLEGMLVRRWLMCEGPSMLAIGMEVGGLLSRHGLHCAKESDLTYLGFLLACHGWVDAFRPLMRRCLELYLLDGGVRAAEGAPSIRVMLIPPGEELRTLLSQLHPNSPAAWQFRLSSRSSDRNETAAVRSVLQLLDAAPLEFEIDHDGRRESG